MIQREADVDNVYHLAHSICSSAAVRPVSAMLWHRSETLNTGTAPVKTTNGIPQEQHEQTI